MVRVAGEVEDEFQFFRRSVDDLAVDFHLIVCEVDGELVVLDEFSLRGGRDMSPAQDRLDAGDDLLRVEGFHDVVIGSQLESQDFVECLTFRGDHDDGLLRDLADLPADLPAVHTGQHDVEDDKVGLERLELADGGLTVVHAVDVIPFIFEVQSEEFADVFVVIYDQDFSVAHSLILLSSS